MSKAYVTHLKPEELTTAYLLAATRRGVCRPTRDAQSGDNKTSIDSEVMSLASELVVARLVGSYPTALQGYDPDAADLANGMEVRATSCQHGHLIIRPKDEPRADRVFVFVTYREVVGKTTQFRVWGAIRGRDGMNDDYWHEKWGNGGDPAWLVPTSALRDVRMFGGAA